MLLPVLQDSGLRLFPEASSDAVTGLIGSYRFRLAGRFAIRFLTLSLAISPAVHLFGWRRLVPLRKWAGLWAFAFALLHLSIFLSDNIWRKIWRQDFALIGIAALIILTLMALTSHHRIMKLLGRNWKRLHRMVYIAAVLVVLHSINGMLFWEQIPGFNVALLETQIYGLQIALLLLLRLARVRRLVERLLRMPKQKRGKAKMKA